MTRMHIDELEIDESLVRQLLGEQFPAWSELPVRRVMPAGTEHAIFRLGERMSVRLARRDGPTALGIAAERMSEVPTLPRNLLRRTERGEELSQTLDEICASHSLKGADGVTLLVMAHPQHAGVG